MATRVGTLITNDRCVAADPYGNYKGFCFDIWNKTSYDLNISYNWTVAKNYAGLLKLFIDKKIDVIVERMDHSSMNAGAANLTE